MHSFGKSNTTTRVLRMGIGILLLNLLAFQTLKAAPLPVPPGLNGYSITLLSNGKLLAAGGSHEEPPQAKLYDPASGTWTNTGVMGSKRYWHRATLLSDGNVMVAGGGVGR